MPFWQNGKLKRESGGKRRDNNKTIAVYNNPFVHLYFLFYYVAENTTFYIGAGCSKCFDTGYRGRTGVYELMAMAENIRELVYNKESAGVIKKAAIEGGMRTLRMDGAQKVLDGITTIAEVLRVTQSDIS